MYLIVEAQYIWKELNELPDWSLNRRRGVNFPTQIAALDFLEHSVV